MEGVTHADLEEVIGVVLDVGSTPYSGPVIVGSLGPERFRFGLG